MSEVDFVSSDNSTVDSLKLKEEEGMYPPRFHVVVSCTSDARPSQTRVEFRGAVKDVVFDVPLNLVGATSKCIKYILN